MNILLIDQYFYPDLQITSILLTDLALQLAGYHDITVICGTPSSLRDENMLTEEERSLYKKIKVKLVPSTIFSRTNMGGRLINYMSFLILAFVKSLTIPKEDVIISMSTPPLSAFVISLASSIRKIPYIFVCQDFFPYTAIKTGLLKNSIIIDFLLRLTRFTLKRCRTVVAISEIMKKKIANEGIPDKKIEIIRNWANIDLIKPGNKDNDFSRKYNLHDKFVVLYAGNIGLMQNTDIILDTIKRLQSYKRLYFVIAGAGVKKETLEEVIKKEDIKNVLIVPFQTGKTLHDMYASSDVCLILQKEGLAGYVEPTKTYYIMASGRAAIASIEHESETAKVISEADCGFITPPGNTDEILKYIKYLYADPNKTKYFGKKAREFIEKHNYREIAFARYKQLIEEVIK